MPSPVRPSEIAALVPSGTSSLCQRMLDVFLKLPRKLSDLLSWMFNEDGTLTDEFIHEVAVFPVGTVIARMSTVIPNGWLACSGQEVSRVTYAMLFSVIGTAFGAGNGTTTFNVPNLQDRFIYGKGSTSNVGDSGGEAEHTLTVAEMPSHSHDWKFKTERDDSGAGGSYDEFTKRPDDSAGFPPLTAFEEPIDNTGGGEAHNNIPPFVRAAYLIKT